MKAKTRKKEKTTARRTAKAVGSGPLLRLVRAKQGISIRELSRRLRASQSRVLDACEGEGLNINIGVRVGGSLGSLIGEHTNIGDYTVEDLS